MIIIESGGGGVYGNIDLTSPYNSHVLRLRQSFLVDIYGRSAFKKKVSRICGFEYFVQRFGCHACDWWNWHVKRGQ